MQRFSVTETKGNRIKSYQREVRLNVRQLQLSESFIKSWGKEFKIMKISFCLESYRKGPVKSKEVSRVNAGAVSLLGG